MGGANPPRGSIIVGGACQGLVIRCYYCLGYNGYECNNRVWRGTTEMCRTLKDQTSI
jgi:hypothetical protein